MVSKGCVEYLSDSSPLRAYTRLSCLCHTLEILVSRIKSSPCCKVSSERTKKEKGGWAAVEMESCFSEQTAAWTRDPLHLWVSETEGNCSLDP